MGKAETTPLSVAMENARGRLIQAFSQISAEAKLPAFLMESAVLELLAEITAAKEDPPESKEEKEG